MHELSIAMNIIDIAGEYAAKANTKTINEIEIEVGELSGVVIEALEFAMENAKKIRFLKKQNALLSEFRGEFIAKIVLMNLIRIMFILNVQSVVIAGRKLSRAGN